MIDYEFILFFGVAGYMWSEVLTREGMIFGWFPKWMHDLPNWLKKPAYACAICVTGFHCTVNYIIELHQGEMALSGFLIHPLLAMLLTKILLRYA